MKRPQAWPGPGSCPIARTCPGAWCITGTAHSSKNASSPTLEKMVEGMRDVVAYAAEARAAREVGVAIDAEAAALRAFARALVLRVPVVTVGAHLPVFALLAEISAEPPVPTAHPPALLPAGCDLNHDLDVDGVTFAYSPHTEPIVPNLTLHVSEGMHLTVVDPSEVGKPTLANLLASIQDNLVYLQPYATSTEIDETVAAVGLAGVISRRGSPAPQHRLTCVRYMPPQNRSQDQPPGRCRGAGHLHCDEDVFDR